MIAALVAAGWLVALGDGPAPAPAPAAGWMVVEATRLQQDHATPFFAALIAAAPASNKAGLTPAVLALVEQADGSARIALQARLELARPPAAFPLTEADYQALKARVVGHAEAIVLEGVLTPDQARRWRDRATRPAQRPGPGRYSTILVDYSDGHLPAEFTRGAVYSIIYDQSCERVCSTLFALMLGWDLKQPTPDLAASQVEALRAQEALARAARRFWLFRDIGPKPRQVEERTGEAVGELPATPAMMERITDPGLKRLASLVGHAEAIALDAILAPEQAERAKLALWRDRKVHALLDPELADRLKLTRDQRTEIAARLFDRVEVFHKLVRSDVPLFNKDAPHEFNPAMERFKQRVAGETADLDRPTWNVLRPAQLRELARLLGQPVAGINPPGPSAQGP